MWKLGLLLDREVLSRNSWVTAMPIDAKDSDVRSQARNVLSVEVSVAYQVNIKKSL